MNTVANHMLYSINKSQDYKSFECKLAEGIVFEFTRFTNLVNFADDPNVTSSYIIQCNIKNNIGVIIYSFKMNEADTMRFIDSVGNFLYYFTDTGSSYYIGLPVSNSTNGHYPSFEFINTNRFVDDDDFLATQSIYFNNDTGECRYFDLTIYDAKDHYAENQILKIPMSPSEIEDLMFQICLTANVDFGDWLNENFDDTDMILYY